MNRKKRYIFILILLVALTQMGGVGMSPMLADLNSAFPKVSTVGVQMVSTLPSIFTLIASYIAASIAARGSRKRLLTAGTALVALYAILGVMIHRNIIELYLWAAILGTGVGINNTAATILINESFQDQEKVGILGKQSFASSVGMMLMTFAGGFLVEKKWYLNYLVYLIIVPALFMTITMKGTPGKQQADYSTKRKNCKKRMKIRGLILPLLLSFGVTLFYTVCVTNTSMYIVDNRIGTSAEAGMIMTLISLVGAVTGLLIGRVTKIFGTFWTATLGFLNLLIGYLIFFRGHSLPAVVIASIFCGTAICLVMPNATYLASAGNESSEKAIALVLMGSNVGTLISPVLTGLAAAVFSSDAVKYRYLLGAVLSGIFFAALFVFYFCGICRRKDRKTA